MCTSVGHPKPRAMSALGLFCRLLFAITMVGVPVLALFYFVYYEPLGGLATSSSEILEVRANYNPLINDIIYKVDAMSSVFVRTKSGAVQGERIIGMSDKELDVFLGIPFAEPPLGELRFRKPTAVRPWAGVYRAIRHGRPCLQYPLSHRIKETPWVSEEISSEDCLYLNIWAPGNSGKGLKPVMIWIYGGALISGSADVLAYDGGALAAFGDVLVVTFNYRLGIFGFLNANHESAPGNMGLHDQVSLQLISATFTAIS